MSESWSYVQNGATQGPITEDALRQLLGSGQLRWDDLVWRPGLTEWTQAGQIPELRSTPPPAPAPASIPAQATPRNAYEPPRSVVMSAPDPSSLDAQSAVAGAMDALRATKPWVRFMGVLGILGTALLVVIALILIGVSQGPFKTLPPGVRVVLPLVYLLMAALQVPPVLHLNRYASRIGILLETHAPEDLTRALDAQKSFWKYVGIMTLIMMCTYVLIFIFAVGMAAVVGAGHRF